MQHRHETEYCFPVPQAARLASLIGLRSDMQQVLAYCNRMIDRYSGSHLKKSPFDVVGFSTPVDFIEWEALSTATCVSYARCFISGVRQSLDCKLLEAAESEYKALHNFVVALRNKHIAHSVNSFEENTVIVHIGEHFQSSCEIQTVTPSNMRVPGLSFGMPERLKHLAKWWLSKIDEEMSVETVSVLKAAQATPLLSFKAFGVRQSPNHDDRVANVGKRRPNP